MSPLVSDINEKILLLNPNDRNTISDGYHSFEELYEHRFALFIALAHTLSVSGNKIVWKARKHSDGSFYDGWFILGIGIEKGEQISYHLPENKWERCYFAIEKACVPNWDGHSSNDVINRLAEL